MPFKSRDVSVTAIGEDWKTVVLLRRLIYVNEYTGESYIVPKGLRSDYGSIPRILWWWLPPHQYRPEYLLHDHLYQSQPVSREKADKILLQSLKEAGANWFRRNIIYSGVRIGGWVAWRKA